MVTFKISFATKKLLRVIGHVGFTRLKNPITLNNYVLKQYIKPSQLFINLKNVCTSSHFMISSFKLFSFKLFTKGCELW
jgi:hypothetical protein